MGKKKIVLVISGLLVSVLVFSLTVKSNQTDNSTITNIENDKTYQSLPPILETAGVSHKAAVELRLSRDKIKKTIKLEYISSSGSKSRYTFPVIAAGEYQIFIDNKFKSSFTVKYYKDNVVDYKVCTNIDLSELESNNCFKQYLLSSLNTPGDIERALKEIVEISSKGNSPNSNFRCHLLVHWVGESSVIAYNKLEDALKNDFTLCDKGYLHGVISASILNRNIETIKSDIDHLCDYFNNLAEIKSCIHGLGHDFYKKFGGSEKAFEYCGLLTEKDYMNECASGVSMDVGFSYLERPADILSTDPNFVNEVCLSVKSEMRNGCYRFIFLVYNRLGADSKLNQILKNICEQVQGEDLVSCWAGAGIEYTTAFPSVSTKKLWDFCNQAEGEAMKYCVTSSIYYRIQQFNQLTAEQYCNYIKGYRNDKEFCEFWKAKEKESSSSYGIVYKR